MKRALGISLAMLLAVPLAASAAPTQIDLTVAKTQARIYAYGTVIPPHPDRRVRIRFFNDDGSGYELAATSWDTLSAARDSDGDGVKESHYEVTFDRPTSGACKVVVRYRSASGSVVKDEEPFGCAIPDFSTGSATMTSDADLVTIDLLIAETGEQQGYGLMYRRFLAADKGMVFLFEQDTNASFYMDNTLIPLSIAFFDSAGQILKIMDMEPCDAEDPNECPLYSPGVSYRGALEVNQGAFGTWGVTEGDVIQVTQD